MIELSPAFLIRTALSIVGLTSLLMILQYRPAEILGFFKTPPAVYPGNVRFALAALRKYFIASGLVVFTLHILTVLKTLTSPQELWPGIAAAIVGVLFSLFFAYPICGLGMRRLEKHCQYPRFAFRVGFRNDRCTLFLLASTGIVFVLIVVIIMMLLFDIGLDWMSFQGIRILPPDIREMH